MLHYDDRDDDGEAFCLTHDDPWPHLSHDTQKRAVRQLLRPLLDPKHAGDDGFDSQLCCSKKKRSSSSQQTIHTPTAASKKRKVNHFSLFADAFRAASHVAEVKKSWEWKTHK